MCLRLLLLCSVIVDFKQQHSVEVFYDLRYRIDGVKVFSVANTQQICVYLNLSR